ncbi:MAG: DUF5050 domain-containing protein [Chloroflexota bacterium]
MTGSGAETIIPRGNNGGGGAVEIDSTAGKIYWFNHEGDGANLCRANLDGTELEVLVENVSRHHGLALDTDTQKIYWTTAVEVSIQQANFDGSPFPDGSKVKTIYQGDRNQAGRFRNVAVSNGKIYWTSDGHGVNVVNTDGTGWTVLDRDLKADRAIAVDATNGHIYIKVEIPGQHHNLMRIDLDGSNQTNIVENAGDLADIELDVAGGKIYYTDYTKHWLKQINLDGSDSKEMITDDAGHSPYFALNLP